MIRLALGAVSTLCLLAAAFLLLQSDAFPELLPGDAAGWIAAYFNLFREPLTAAAVLAFCMALTVVSACVTEILLGLIFSLVSGAASLACLLGFLGSHYPPLADSLQGFFR